MNSSDPLAFLDLVNMDPDLSQRVFDAITRGNLVSAEEIMGIAREAGFEFTREEFESASRANLKSRFTAGEVHLAEVVADGRKKPVPSSCASGCVSWTTNYHPIDYYRYEPQAERRA